MGGMHDFKNTRNTGITVEFNFKWDAEATHMFIKDITQCKIVPYDACQKNSFFRMEILESMKTGETPVG